MWTFLIAVANVLASVLGGLITKVYLTKKITHQHQFKNEQLYAEHHKELLESIKDLENENIEYSREIISLEQNINKRKSQYNEIVDSLMNVLLDEDIEIPGSILDKLNELNDSSHY